MDILTIILIVVSGFVAGAGIVWFIVSKLGSQKKDGSLLMLQNQINELTRTVDSKIGESSRATQEAVRAQLGESAKIITDVTEKLTKLDETNKQVINFADQLQALQDILQNPKQRGVLGEYYLETVLKNVLPPGRYEMQYKFSNGEIVDAAIFLDKDKILPIDAKFSLENYNRIIQENDKNERSRLEKIFKQDIKNRIDETSKYIRPQENTMDIAFMFIPSEAIYYDLLINKIGAVKTTTRDLIEYAYNEKHVIVVSPTSFMAYLQTVLQGLKSLQIEESAKEIRKRVEELGRHIGNYDQFMAKLGSSLAATVNHYNTAHKELKKIDKDVYKISGNSPSVEPKVIDKPNNIEER